jgi:hypothetical protein
MMFPIAPLDFELSASSEMRFSSRPGARPQATLSDTNSAADGRLIDNKIAKASAGAEELE